MGEILHLGALAPAAIGACCVAADRRRARAPELAASVLMLVAMLDVVLGGVVAPVVWAAVLIVAAIALAALRGRARRVRTGRGSRRAPVPSPVMTVHATLGLVVMAAVVMAMIPDASTAAPVAHHGSGAPFGVMAAASALLFGVVSAFSVVSGASGVSVRATPSGAVHASALERGQLIAMGASTAVMGVALLA